MKPVQIVGCLLLLLAAYLHSQGGGGGILTDQITQATYVYEKDQSGGVPPGVQHALGEINKAGKVSAAAFDVDVVDSTLKTPPQYKIAVDAAKTAGLPALVVQAGEKVVKTLTHTKDSPLTAEQVLEAVK